MPYAPGSASVVPSRSAAAQVRAYFSLLKPRIVVPLTSMAAASAVVAKGGAMPLGTIATLVLAGGLASAGSACLNHYLDRDIDALMVRTRHRPLPSGRIGNPRIVALLGLLLLGTAVLVASRLNPISLAFIVLGAFFYVVVYTAWLKRSSPLNVVVGGFAGSCAALAGWFAADATFSWTPALVGLVVFLWTPAHFWSLATALREDYHRASVPMLPVVAGVARTAVIILLSTVLTSLVSLLPYYLGFFGPTYLAAALLAALLTLASNVQLLRAPSDAAAWRSYRLSGLYLGLLFLGMLADAFARGSAGS